MAADDAVYVSYNAWMESAPMCDNCGHIQVNDGSHRFRCLNCGNVTVFPIENAEDERTFADEATLAAEHVRRLKLRDCKEIVDWGFYTTVHVPEQSRRHELYRAFHYGLGYRLHWKPGAAPASLEETNLFEGCRLTVKALVLGFRAQVRRVEDGSAVPDEELAGVTFKFLLCHRPFYGCALHELTDEGRTAERCARLEQALASVEQSKDFEEMRGVLAMHGLMVPGLRIPLAVCEGDAIDTQLQFEPSVDVKGGWRIRVGLDTNRYQPVL